MAGNSTQTPLTKADTDELAFTAKGIAPVYQAVVRGAKLWFRVWPCVCAACRPLAIGGQLPTACKTKGGPYLLFGDVTSKNAAGWLAAVEAGTPEGIK